MTEPLPTNLPASSPAPEGEVQVHLSPNQRAWLRFRRNKAAWFSGWFFLVLIVIILFWPLVAKQSAIAITELQFSEPGGTHWFGTDVHGRDLLSRILHGARISLLVGAVGASVSLVIGVLWGAIAGYLGGRWDNAMMRFVDILYSLPSIIFVIVLITTLEGLFRTWLGRVFSPDLAADRKSVV